MFFRIAILALLTLSFACKKQQRTIIRGFNPEAETTTQSASIVEGSSTSTDAEADDTTIDDEVVKLSEYEQFKADLDLLFSLESLTVIRDAAVADAVEALVSQVNAMRIEEGKEELEFNAILDSGEYGDIATEISHTINDNAGTEVKKLILELEEGLTCELCLIYLSDLVISVDNNHKVYISDFSLVEDYKNGEELYRRHALEVLNSEEESNEGKADLLASIHYGKIDYTDAEVVISGTTEETRAKVVALEIESKPIVEIKTPGIVVPELKPIVVTTTTTTTRPQVKALEIESKPVVEIKTPGIVTPEIKPIVVPKVEVKETTEESDDSSEDEAAAVTDPDMM